MLNGGRPGGFTTAAIKHSTLRCNLREVNECHYQINLIASDLGQTKVFIACGICCRIVHAVINKKHALMPGKQAKVLSSSNIHDLLALAASSRYPQRNIAIVQLSVKAGLRAAEIAKLTWAMVLDATGEIGATIELHNRAAKRHRGRRLPIHPDLRRALQNLAKVSETHGPLIKSERGGAMRPISIVMWFREAYRRLGLDGCSSHSGRRTFITNAARLVHKAGGSLRDVQMLAGHTSIQTTERYIDGDSDAQRRLISLL